MTKPLKYWVAEVRKLNPYYVWGRADGCDAHTQFVSGGKE